MRILNGRELKEESQLRTFELISRSYGKQGRQENKGVGIEQKEGRRRGRETYDSCEHLETFLIELTSREGSV